MGGKPEHYDQPHGQTHQNAGTLRQSCGVSGELGHHLAVQWGKPGGGVYTEVSINISQLSMMTEPALKNWKLMFL